MTWQVRAPAALLAVAVIGGLSACIVAPPPVPPATAEERQAAHRAVTECTIARVRELDDRVSDATTIARAVASSCLPQRQYMREVEARGDPAFLYFLNRHAYIDDLDFATKAVLIGRGQSK
jgi:hypothetical protein